MKNAIERIEESLAKVSPEEGFELLTEAIVSYGIAMNVIAAKKAQYAPMYQELIEKGMAFLIPSESVRVNLEKLYEPHCEEIIDRLIAEGVDSLDYPTKAEMLGVCISTMRAGQLNRDGSVLAEELIEELFPEDAQALTEAGIPSAMETYIGAAKELRERLRQDMKAKRVVVEKILAQGDKTYGNASTKL